MVKKKKYNKNKSKSKKKTCTLEVIGSSTRFPVEIGFLG